MRNRLLVVMLAASLVLAAGAWAQDTFGTISGSVTDSTGAAIPGAKITVRSTDKGIVVREVVSGEAGLYTITKLVIGRYSVTVEATGFKKVTISSIELNVGEIYKSNVSMQVGSVVETVTVEAAALQVETESAIAGNLITGDQIRELSLNNRNYEQLVSLSPGVAYGGGDQLFIGTTNPTSGQVNTLSFSINGQRTSANNWTVDGADNVDRGSNLTLLNYPSVEAIAEFKVLRNIYSAEFGRAASGNVNVITRSGSRTFHGNAYEFVRNDIFNANTFVNNANGAKRPPLRYNNFGWTLSGPVFIPGLFNTNKDDRRTFFFFSQEFRRQNVPSAITATVPTAQEKLGNFSKPVCNVVNTYTSACPAGSTGTTVAAINPIALEYLTAIWNSMPVPTNPETHQFFGTFQSQFRTRQELVRVDHVFGPRWSVFARYLNDTIPTTEPGGLFTGAVLPGVSNTSTDSPGRSWVAKTVNVITPSFVMEAGYSYSYGAIVSRLAGRMSSSVSTVTAPLPFAVSLGRIPSASYTNGASTITGFGPYDDFNRNHNVFANLSKQFRKHTIRFGFTYNHYQKTENAAGNNAGTFNFNANGAVLTGLVTTPTCNLTCQQADARFQQTWANFLLGDVNLFTQASLDLTPDIQTNQLEWYLQDSWKVHPNLTLDFGLRHSIFRQPHDNNKLFTTFDPSAYNPARAPVVSATTGNITSAAGTFDPLNGITVAGAAGAKYGNKVAKEDTLNFAPRFGFSWDPFGKGRTAVRGGYGIAFDSGLVGIFEQNIFTNPPFTQSVSISNTRFENAASAVPTLSAGPTVLRATAPDLKIPYAQSWSLDVQQELPWKVLAAVGYYGNKGTHLIGTEDINQPTPGQIVIVAGLRQICAVGVAPCTTVASPHINAVRPYQGYGPINSIQSIFTSNYNSLQMSLQKRFSGGNSLNASYTWSHGLTTAQTDRSSSPQDHYNIRGEYGSSQLDRRHIFSANWVYELPWMKDQHGFVGHVLGGWQTSGILYAYTGLPLTITTSGLDPGGQGYDVSTSLASGRPDNIRIAVDPHGTSFQTGVGRPWLDTTAYAAVCLILSPNPCPSRPGTSGRGVAVGPGFWKVDFSLFKNFRLSEQVRFQFRFETFNFFNHTNPNGVNTTQTSATFGKITSYRDPREMQFGFKLSF
jgi:hypothetical protein